MSNPGEEQMAMDMRRSRISALEAENRVLRTQIEAAVAALEDPCALCRGKYPFGVPAHAAFEGDLPDRVYHVPGTLQDIPGDKALQFYPCGNSQVNREALSAIREAKKEA